MKNRRGYMLRAAIPAVLLLVAAVAFQQTSPGQTPTLETGFRDTVHPFVKTYCFECHSGAKPKGDLDLSTYNTAAAVTKDLAHWESVLEQLDMGVMPPSKAKQQPSADARKAVVAWIRDMRSQEGKRNAGDPGPVPVRRLSNAEYNYTIRDLTGVDIKPAKTFPVDPANEAGFDNSAESLTMSPALLNKYLEAARTVSEHLVLHPEGLTFAPYPVIADTDRDKYCVRQIMDFYQKQKMDYADYFEAAWQFNNRVALEQPNVKLADIAAKKGLSIKYLETLNNLVTGPKQKTGPIAVLQNMWAALPAPEGKESNPRTGFVEMREFIVKIRPTLVPVVNNLTAPGLNAGTQILAYWKDRKMASVRRVYAPGSADKLKLDQFSDATTKALTSPTEPEALAAYEKLFVDFCSVFPDEFVITERARVYMSASAEAKLTGRFLSAGLHSMTGYFRDDGPMYELLLSPEQQTELDRLWLQFDAVSGAPIRQITSLIWFERSDSSFMRSADFDWVRAEDHDIVSEAKMKKMSDVWIAKAKAKGHSATAIQAAKDHFELTSAQIRRLEKARLDAEPKHLVALREFAEKAYRRPLTKKEGEGVAEFYSVLREQDELSHEDAVRDVIVGILMSPHFLYRVSPVAMAEPAPRKGVQTQSAVSADAAGAQKSDMQIVPLSKYELANRLSYFLWSSMPDAKLLDVATSGNLQDRDVLLAQVKRLVNDDKVDGMVTEFAGNWLDFRRFEEHNAVDRERFKTFTDELREAMFEEPLHFTTDVIRSDRSILDFLYANYTFVNPILAKHYGMTVAKAGNTASRKSKSPPSDTKSSNPTTDNWVRIDNANEYGRGGLLPMAVFLTKNAPGLRTSPVKRGYWVVRRLLGEKIPPPPAEVPDLPSDESKLGDLTLREVLEHHRADKNCATCHARFDSMGLTFEGYGPVGELRTLDLGGRKVDTHAQFPGGGEGTGLDGLRNYIKERRQDDFVDNLCRKFTAFALGRTLIPSDDDLIAELKVKLAANEYRFNTLIETIVTSRQFLNKRSGV